ncbi:hypothetical protein EMCG_00526 [[Emmonsia] crescens]|uniref:Uncharacterized protein n=1 Tax=[Emmonsia] crescens TaxID=73230 RepID=A0A0G2IZW3_9EURO|nr:hypothetical protein EMCG_00526 [Emmonsia crescens UAMH 3008]
MRGPAAISAAGGVEFFNQNTTSQTNTQSINNTLNELQLKLQISCIECEKAEIKHDNLRLHLELMKNHSNQSNPLTSSVSHLHDWQILDILYKRLSGFNLHKFIQIKIEAKCTFKAVAVTLDIDTLLDEISTLLPAEINQSTNPLIPPSSNQIMTSINHLPTSRAVAAATADPTNLAAAANTTARANLILLLLPILPLLVNVAATATAMAMKIHPATIRTLICIMRPGVMITAILLNISRPNMKNTPRIRLPIPLIIKIFNMPALLSL